MSNSLWVHGLQDARRPYPSLSWSLLILTSIESVMTSNRLILCCLFFFCLQSFPALGSFPVSQLFPSSGQSTRASALVLTMNILLISLVLTGPCCPTDSQESSTALVWKYQFFSAQHDLWSNSHIHIWLLEKPQLWLYGPLSVKWCLCFLISSVGLSKV